MTPRRGPTRLKNKLAGGGIAVGVTVNFAHPGLAEFLGDLGVDAVMIDGEHGPITEDNLEAIAIACDLAGCASILRVIADDAAMQRLMGSGLSGIQRPQVRSAEDVLNVVAAVKYPPQGHRGLGNSRAGRYGLGDGGFPKMMKRSNQDTIVLVQIEDRAGVNAASEIAAIPGVDCIIIGEADLSNDLGVPGQREHPEVVAAADRVIEAAAAAGKPVGLAANTSAEACRAIDRGARLLITSVTRGLSFGLQPLLETGHVVGAQVR